MLEDLSDVRETSCRWHFACLGVGFETTIFWMYSDHIDHRTFVSDQDYMILAAISSFWRAF